MSEAPRLGVLLSGGGRTLENLFEKLNEGELPVQIAVVISSHENAGGMERARKRSVPTFVVDYRKTPEPAFSERIGALLQEHHVDLVVMAGFIRHWNVPDAFRNRVLNIHPALLPDFGGKGMWGHHVHEAVLESGKKESGCTVHWVTDDYDRGPVIVQKKVSVSPNDTPETLAAKVFEQECLAYPEAIRKALRI